MKFPKSLLVAVSEDNYLITLDNPEQSEDGQSVAVYQLVEVKKAKHTIELVSTKKKGKR